MKELKQLQGQITTLGLLSHPRTLAALIAFCSLTPAGDLSYARQLFERVTLPNLYMYNTLIRGYSNSDTKLESILLFRRMLAQGFTPNNFTFPFVLKSTAEKPAFDVVLLIHSMIIKTGFASQVVVMNALLHAYGVSRHVIPAHKVFDEIPQKSIVSWNSIIDGYFLLGDGSSAFGMFEALRGSGSVPDEFTITTLLSVCSQSKNLNCGRILHHYTLLNSIDSDLIVGNALLDMYGKCGEPVLAQMSFDRMPVKNVVTWTSLVRAYAENGMLNLARRCFDQMPERSAVSWNAMMDCYISIDECHQVLDLYDRMRVSGTVPDEATFVNVLSACSQIGNFVVGKQTHYYIVQNITNPSPTVLNSIVDMYAKCGHLDVAFNLFRLIDERNVVSWNVMIAASAVHGNATDAVELFRAMTGHGFFPDGITFVGLLSACSHGGLLEAGQHYFEAMDVQYNVRHEIEHYACMVDMFGRRGCISRAIEFVRSMPMRPDVVIWGALLGACRIHHDLKTGLQVMRQVLGSEPYSSGLFVLMSNLFCETGRWEELRKLRKLMKEEGVRKVEGRSSIEIGGEMHEFVVEDTKHESSSNIYLIVDQLMEHLKSLASLSVSLGELFNTEE